METRGCHYIDGRWKQGSGHPFISTNPATTEQVWKGTGAAPRDVDQAVHAARTAAPFWAGLPLEQRASMLRAFAAKLGEEKENLAETISIETGKPLWESSGEVSAMINKIEISIEAYAQRCAERVDQQPNSKSTTRHKAHGVLAVFGPFNFPGHLPNGHIVPALLAGNTVIFKPSELTPLVAERTVELWDSCQLPPGVLNLTQGGRDTGQALAQHPQIDGLLFTGSAKTGLGLSKHFGAFPDKILALEMGGNNPLVITNVKDLKAAAYATILSAFLTSGQRCTCARRLIVPIGSFGDAFLNLLCEMTSRLVIGSYNDQPQPFMGPVISGAAAKQLIDAQDKLLATGASALLPLHALELGEAFLSPGILDVTQVGDRPDEELFGPLLQVIRVRSFDEAILEANNTRFGLAAGLLSDDAAEFERFFAQIRAGVVNWNTALTGASSRMPFGGIGLSGNHRPSAFYAADYCVFPVASMEAPQVSLPANLAPGINI